ncbi:TetR/AcrR family transcriptional regulator [Falsiroseomonas sp.]|uniref:TetR/AcrR family transcriptional regulator n=1 Tax=Falsiroseomonas sp. TaxID=2870721 RepID=UPI00271F8197|nr:TetR/AcrR family transcriptional regulator [Falsiroseomonas sp.]MDO9500757.1 TetR/AcrR family transcriptional regulator [Falsiroseomonas sp.]
MSGVRIGKGQETRTRILDAAQASVLAKGFGATSIEELIAETGLTKSGFFYHFRDKNELAKALLRRYIAEDERVYDRVFGQARELTDDPLQVLLVGLKLLADLMADLPNGHPGCLVATSCYYERLFDRDVRALNAEAALLWRRRFRAMFEDIATAYRPRGEVPLDELADMISTVLEGAIIMSKALDDPLALERQILALRGLLKAFFVPLPRE